MEERRIIYKGKTTKGTNVVVRYPTKNDLQQMTDYINILSRERTYILFQGEETSLEEEKEFLDSLLKKISVNKVTYLLVLHNDKMVGSCSIKMKDKVEKHVGELGISIAKDFRGKGIGKLLMKLVLEEAKKNLSDLKICVLGVFGDNDIAKKMYINFGFKEFGKLPGGVRHKDKFVDHYYMYKEI